METIGDLIADRDRLKRENEELRDDLIPPTPRTVTIQRLVERAEAAERENKEWRGWGIVEVSVRNPSVAEYCKHWEGRTEKAERELTDLRKKATHREYLIRENDALTEKLEAVANELPEEAKVICPKSGLQCIQECSDPNRCDYRSTFVRDAMADYIKVEREREDTAMQLDAWKMSFAKEARAHEQTIIERDNAEETVSEIYFRIIGDSPEWSNLFGHAQAVEEITDAFDAVRETAKANVSDAERYHKLRAVWIGAATNEFSECQTESELDAAIDSARNAGKEGK